MKKVTKTFLSADVSLQKLNNKHIKKIFHDTGHGLSSETSIGKTVQQ